MRLAYDILPTGFESSVRVRLGLEPDNVTDLPDTVIQDLANEAEILIKNKCPAWQAYKTAGGDSWTLIQTATIWQVCALLCPSMGRRSMLKESDATGYSYQRQEIDWGKKEIEFNSKVASCIYLATGETATLPSVLGVVSNDSIEI